MREKERPPLHGLHDFCWVGVVQKYLNSIVAPQFVIDRLCDPIGNRQSTNDTVQERFEDVHNFRHQSVWKPLR